MHFSTLKYLQELFRLRNCKFLKHVVPNIRVLYTKMNKSIQKEIMQENNADYGIQIKVIVLNARRKYVNSTSKTQYVCMAGVCVSTHGMKIPCTLRF